jgi:hypothetical protein
VGAVCTPVVIGVVRQSCCYTLAWSAGTAYAGCSISRVYGICTTQEQGHCKQTGCVPLLSWSSPVSMPLKHLAGESHAAPWNGVRKTYCNHTHADQTVSLCHTMQGSPEGEEGDLSRQHSSAVGLPDSLDMLTTSDFTFEVKANRQSMVTCQPPVLALPAHGSIRPAARYQDTVIKTVHTLACRSTHGPDTWHQVDVAAGNMLTKPTCTCPHGACKRGVRTGFLPICNTHCLVLPCSLPCRWLLPAVCPTRALHQRWTALRSPPLLRRRPSGVAPLMPCALWASAR